MESAKKNPARDWFGSQFQVTLAGTDAGSNAVQKVFIAHGGGVFGLGW
jgi:hypothetical protein